MLDLTQLRSFCTVAVELHFGRAAQKLNITQPPLSRQIKLLEESLGVQLLKRGRHGVALTPAGRSFLPEAQKLLRQSDELVQLARRAARPQVGRLRIGFIAAATFRFLPLLVSALRSELPEVELICRDLPAVAQISEVERGRLDIGLIRPQTSPMQLQAACILREPLILAAPLDHPLARIRRPRLDQLEGVDFVMYSAESPHLHAMLTAAFRASDVHPHFVQHMDTVQAILSLVSAGMGLAIVPGHAAAVGFENLLFREIDLGNSADAELLSIWREEDGNPLVPLALSIMRRVGETLNAEKRIERRRRSI